MKTRKISAHYIFPGEPPLLKFGILECAEDGKILSLTDTGGVLKESAGLEFYNGMIIPGLLVGDIKNELPGMCGKHCPGVEMQEIINLVKALDPDNGLIRSAGNIEKILMILLKLQQTMPACRLEELLTLFTSKPAAMNSVLKEYGTFKPGRKPGIYLLVNLDLVKLKILNDTSLIQLTATLLIEGRYLAIATNDSDLAN